MSEIKIEGVYYSSPFPRSFAVLTVLGLVFDRIHLPYVSLPDNGFAVSDLEERIAGLRELAEDPTYSGGKTAIMTAALQHTRWKEWTKGFIVYPHSAQKVWDVSKTISDDLVKAIYDLTFPPRKNFTPTFSSLNSFAITPGEGASIEYPGQFHYSAGAYMYAAENNLPLINDIPMLGMPEISVENLKYDASTLASVLAVECIKLVLPQIPLMDISELLDFRDEMAPHTEPFKTSLLKVAQLLNQELDNVSSFDELGKAAKFIIETEIQPSLVELRAFAESPDRPWYKNILKIGKPLGVILTGGIWSIPVELQLSKALEGYFSQAVAGEISRAKKDKMIASNPLYYLLQVEQLANKR